MTWLYLVSVVGFGMFVSDLLAFGFKVAVGAYYNWRDRDLIAKRKKEYETSVAKFYAAAAEEKAAQLTDDVEGLPHA